MNKKEWTPVTRQKPCPACGKPDWCAWTNEGWLKCERSDVPPAGMVLVNRKDGGALFRPEADSTTRSAPKRKANRRSTPARIRTAFERHEDAVQAYERSLGKHDAQWRYFSADGKHVGTALRWHARPDRDKLVRPIGLIDGRWQCAGMPEPRPLLGLKELQIVGPVIVVEGEGKVDAARLLGYLATTSAQGSGHVRRTDWSPLRGREVVIFPDNDPPGETYATTVASILLNLDSTTIVRIVTLPDLPAKGDIVDFVRMRTDAGRSHEDIRKEIDALIAATTPTSVGSVSSSEGDELEIVWGAAESLPELLPPVMAFDLRLLPEVLRPWIADISDRVQCPPDFPAVAAVIALATVVGRKVGIRPKRFDDWMVIPNLWGAVVGRPGVMKTPGLQEALRPLHRLEALAKKEYDERVKERAVDAMLDVARRKDVEKRVRETIAKDPLEARRLALESIPEEYSNAPRKRYIVNDGTVEKIGEILNENPDGVMVFRDELVGLLKILDKEGREGDRAFYLEAWNGTGRFTYDRIGRGTIDIEAATLSVLGGIQPGPLSQYLFAASKEGRGDDGLLQRFQLLVWPDISGAWRNVDRFPDSDARRAAHAVYTNLADLEPDLIGADQDGTDERDVPFLRFTEEAQEAFDIWREGLERQVRSGELPPALESHFAKYRSLIPSLALLFHLADGGRGPVTLASLERAIRWDEYLETHARRLYAQTTNAEIVAAHALAKHILSARVESGFALREIYRKGWTNLGTVEDAKGATTVLIELGWLQEHQVETGGRKGAVYLINPAVIDREFLDSPSGRGDRTDTRVASTPSVGSVSCSPGGDDENSTGNDGDLAGGDHS